MVLLLQIHGSEEDKTLKSTSTIFLFVCLVVVVLAGTTPLPRSVSLVVDRRSFSPVGLSPCPFVWGAGRSGKKSDP